MVGPPEGGRRRTRRKNGYLKEAFRKERRRREAGGGALFLLDAREGKMGKGRMQAEGCREQRVESGDVAKWETLWPVLIEGGRPRASLSPGGPTKKPGKQPILWTDGETEGKPAAGIATATFGDGVPVRSRSHARLGLVELAQPKDVSTCSRLVSCNLQTPTLLSIRTIHCLQTQLHAAVITARNKAPVKDLSCQRTRWTPTGPQRRARLHGILGIRAQEGQFHCSCAS